MTIVNLKVIELTIQDTIQLMPLTMLINKVGIVMDMEHMLQVLLAERIVELLKKLLVIVYEY